VLKIVLILILLFPLLGFLVLGIGFRSIPKRIASIIGPGTILVSFILSAFIFLSTQQINESTPQHLFTWIRAGSLTIPFDLLADPLSILMLLIVTGVGFIIHVYSAGYMKDDPGFNRFFSYMNLFIFTMLLLVLGASYPVMFIGWEGVGLCSYLLIGFWFKNRDYGNAAKKAFIMNRIGDLGFLLGMFLIFSTFGSLNYSDVFAAARIMPPDNGPLVAITLLLFVGAIGKSAQIPLYTWLPDAMAGPTPVSALIHAATMVTAGVYMIARSNILYMLAPTTLAVVSGVGLATALFAASIAIFQNDIKKVLAYSTISQLGYMFIALGAGAFTGAMFHLTTHAFFKALLFLAAGSVIHAMGGEQDIRKMGGLRKTLPKTYLAFLIGTLAIAGIPPLSGFFSKDEILSHVFEINPVIWALAVAGAVMTAFYMFRLLWLTFSNKFRGTEEQKHHLHESPAVMTVPLTILAILAAAGGIINLTDVFGGSAWLQQYLAPVFADSTAVSNQVHALPSHSQEWLIMGITLALILTGIAIAYSRFVMKQKGMMPDEEKLPLFERVLARKYYVDELYEWAFEKPVLYLSGTFHRILEIRFIDRIVNGIGEVAVRTGNLVRYVQTGNVGFYLFIMIIGIMLILIFNILI
jgi:NADH-quinone oxidoreductase subunit L